MAFLVLAFPSLNDEYFNWIQSYRRENDSLLYKVVDPHFTVIFPLNEMAKNEFVDEIYRQSEGLRPIDFEINKTILHKDPIEEFYYEFLVPEKGYENIINMHDKLYSEKLLPFLRNDIEYIPHITIGKSRDINKSKYRLKNLITPVIKGQIKELTIANFENNKVSKIAVINLH